MRGTEPLVCGNMPRYHRSPPHADGYLRYHIQVDIPSVDYQTPLKASNIATSVGMKICEGERERREGEERGRRGGRGEEGEERRERRGGRGEEGEERREGEMERGGGERGRGGSSKGDVIPQCTHLPSQMHAVGCFVPNLQTRRRSWAPDCCMACAHL